MDARHVVGRSFSQQSAVEDCLYSCGVRGVFPLQIRRFYTGLFFKTNIGRVMRQTANLFSRRAFPEPPPSWSSLNTVNLDRHRNRENANTSAHGGGALFYSVAATHALRRGTRAPALLARARFWRTTRRGPTSMVYTARIRQRRTRALLPASRPPLSVAASGKTAPRL